MRPGHKPVQELADSQKLYILKQYNAGMKIRDIYKRMTGDDARVRDGCEKFIGNERSFRYIANKQALKSIIRKVASKKVKFDTIQDKLKFISDVIVDVNSRPETKLKALELFSDLQKEAGLEKRSDMLMIANPNNIKITPELLREVFMMSRKDMGGLDTLDFSVLGIDELKLLRRSVEIAIENKPDIS